MVIVHVSDLTAQSPCHPANLEPAAAAAVSVTVSEIRIGTVAGGAAINAGGWR